jgi:chloramphenicol-sensitive protein RarD
LLASRVITGFFFLLGLLCYQKKLIHLLKNLTLSHILWLMLSTFLLSINWMGYLYAIKSQQLLQASLGYFISPLFSVLIAWLWFKEPRNFRLMMAILLAFLGVVWMIYHRGGIPWLGLLLAFSLSMYAALHKAYIRQPSLNSVAIETSIMLPFILILMGCFSSAKLNWSDFSLSPLDGALILGSGAVTVIPLICYSYASKKIPLANLGLLSYLSPSIQMFNALYWLGEKMDAIQWITFVLIWCALLVYIFEQFRTRHDAPI